LFVSYFYIFVGRKNVTYERLLYSWLQD